MLLIVPPPMVALFVVREAMFELFAFIVVPEAVVKYRPVVVTAVPVASEKARF